MKGSFKIASIAGIGIYLHWTFLALIAWLMTAAFIASQSVAGTALAFAFVFALFTCVVLHELGHALMAKRFGIKTQDITLLPIGGLARLERMPEKPGQEFWVALAGPLVNVIIAAMLFGALAFTRGLESISNPEFLKNNLLVRLMWVNVFLVAFNLLPAFPMDGGRILRALLAARMGRRRATAIAAKIGQFFAMVLGFIGFFHNPFLIFIAIFVYFGAQAEAELVEATSLIQGLQVRDAMMSRFRALAPDDTLATAVRELLAGSQDEFPVITDSKVEGVLRRQDIIKGLAERDQQIPVRELAAHQCDGVEASAPLEKTLETMRREGCRSIPVLDTGKVVGLLTLDNISELIMVRSALSGNQRPGFTPSI
jgi:Zn-dependent protease/predicted transcriptional regulator